MLSQSKTFSILEVELEDVQSRFEKGELNMDSKAAGKWRWVVNPNDTGVIR